MASEPKRKMPTGYRRTSMIVRDYLSARGSSYPILVVPGDSPPAMIGRSYGWETRTGIIIRHPTAYAKRGWSSMIYRHSTLRIEVGSEWLSVRGLTMED